MKIKKNNDDIIKVPVTLSDFKFKKMSGSWDITFEIQPEILAMAKPLMDCMGDHFVLILARIESKAALDEAIKVKVKL